MGKSCSKWLYEFVSRAGYVLCEEVRVAAIGEGYSKAELKKAREEIGLKTFHQFDGDGETPNWFWYLEE